MSLVARGRQGDQAALEELYRLYEHKAYNVALRMLGNPWDAADVTQEAFIKAFGALDQFRGEARFSTWLHRIVVNAVRDHLRKRQTDPMEDEELDRLAGMNSSAAGPNVFLAISSYSAMVFASFSAMLASSCV